MAEFILGLSGGANGALLPTYFELVGQEEMTDMLKPALKYILTVYAQRYPRQLLRLYNRVDEFYALLMLIVEHHYLTTRDASFAEEFYGLKRVRSVNNDTTILFNGKPKPTTTRLATKDRWIALAFLIGVPYIKSKLDDLYQQYNTLNILPMTIEERQQQELEKPLETLKQKLQRWFIIIYPYVSTTYEALMFVYQFAYLYDKTRYFTPWLHLAGQEIHRITAKDLKEFKKSQADNTNKMLAKYAGDGFFQRIRRWIALSFAANLDMLKYLLPMSLLFFKFLEWWYSSEFYKQQKTSALPVPPPPEQLLPNPEGIQPPSDRSICPLCKKLRTNPTVIPSGYVFCFPCIFKHVEEFRSCPVTLHVVRTDQLRRLYVGP